MACVLRSGLGDSVPTSPRSPSPPYWRSQSAAPTEIASIEEGDSRVSVECVTFLDRLGGHLRNKWAKMTLGVTLNAPLNLSRLEL